MSNEAKRTHDLMCPCYMSCPKDCPSCICEPVVADGPAEGIADEHKADCPCRFQAENGGYGDEICSMNCGDCTCNKPNQVDPTEDIDTLREYRKTATIRAIQYKGKHVEGVCTGPHGSYFDTAPHIHTLEGDMSVSIGDWIATGIKGERWAIKPDVFASTYVPVEPAAPVVSYVENEGWIHVMQYLPKVGDSVELQISDSPGAFEGKYIGESVIENAPHYGCDWTLIGPNGETLWVRYWRLAKASQPATVVVRPEETPKRVQVALGRFGWRFKIADDAKAMEFAWNELMDVWDHHSLTAQPNPVASRPELTGNQKYHDSLGPIPIENLRIIADSDDATGWVGSMARELIRFRLTAQPAPLPSVDVLEALKKLTAEVTGLLGMAEDSIRYAVGNTNVAVLEDRLRIAREAIEKGSAPLPSDQKETPHDIWDRAQWHGYYCKSPDGFKTYTPHINAAKGGTD